jgi:hypothetical protein
MIFDTPIEDNLGPGLYGYMVQEIVFCAGESGDVSTRLRAHKGSCGMMNIISVERLPQLSKKNREAREKILLNCLKKEYGDPIIGTRETFRVPGVEEVTNLLTKHGFYSPYIGELTEISNAQLREICHLCGRHPVATIQKGFSESPFDADKRRHVFWYNPFPSINATERHWKHLCHNCHKQWQAIVNSDRIEHGDAETIDRWNKSMGKNTIFDIEEEKQGVLPL